MKWKRPLSLAAVILILGLYVFSIIFAFLGSPLARNLLMASLFCTIVLPAILYGYQILLKASKKRGQGEEPENMDSPH